MTYKEFKQMIEDQSALEKAETLTDLLRVRLENDPSYDYDEREESEPCQSTPFVLSPDGHDFF